MPDYKKMYFQLAAKVADALELLQAAQCQGEDSYIEDDESLRDAEGGVPYDPPRRFAPPLQGGE